MNHSEQLDYNPSNKGISRTNQTSRCGSCLSQYQNEEVKNTLTTKHPRIVNFYAARKKYKHNNPGRPMVKGIGSITEILSASIITSDPRCHPSYIKETTHFLNTFKDTQLEPSDSLVITNFNVLYNNISHTEGMAAINKMLEENNVDPLLKVFIACKFLILFMFHIQDTKV